MKLKIHHFEPQFEPENEAFFIQNEAHFRSKNDSFSSRKMNLFRASKMIFEAGKQIHFSMPKMKIQPENKIQK